MIIMTNPARFRHRITFQRLVQEKDKNGFPVNGSGTYTDVISVWAEAKTVSGREYNEAAANQNERTVRWIIRYRKGLDEDMQVLFDGRIFKIDAILPDNELRQTLTIVCKEAV